MTKKKTAAKKLFVLDTNVLLHDPFSTFKFKEHDIYIPFVTLEELDGKKSGPSDVNRNARQATRLLDDVVSQKEGSMATGYPLAPVGGALVQGRLFVQRESLPFLAKEHLHKNDNLYLSVLDHLTKGASHEKVVLVTKDLNLRIKARALGFEAEDFLHDHVISDTDHVYRGWRELSEAQLAELLEDASSWKEGDRTFYRAHRGDLLLNEFVHFPDGAMFRVIELGEDDCLLRSVVNYVKDKNNVTGITARNQEQRAALDLLLDDEIDMVALLGPAGTGKTLLALAAAVQSVARGAQEKILFTRANTPLGEDVGFLPGTEVEKMTPWLGALYDNVEVLVEAATSPIEGQKVRELTSESVEVRAITFVRGRTFHRKIVILDEAQNLTPEQMKALVTRAGVNAKIFVLGNLAQIDSPYLSETSSGLAYLVERFKGWPHFGALVLETGERSRLANEGNTRL